MPKDTERTKQLLLGDGPAADPGKRLGLSTGSTLLNLACSGRPDVGFLIGHFYFLVGDSSSGKTFLTLTSFAEAANRPRFKDYRLIYDNGEDGALMDLKKFFGPKMTSRLEPPAAMTSSGEPVCSTTVEEFYYHLDDALDSGKPVLYALDSMDVLTSEDEREKFAERKEAFRKGKTAPGSYGDGKAKKNSSNLRRCLHKLRETESVLLIVNQTRDNLGFGAQFNPKTRSGGRALTFYATLELWSSVKGPIKKRVNGKEHQIGVQCQVRVKKNRITGRDCKVTVPIYWSVGIDDVGGCVDYLIEEGHWKKTKGGVAAPEFDFAGTRDELIALVEEGGLEKELRKTVTSVWKSIEVACRVERKKRYL